MGKCDGCEEIGVLGAKHEALEDRVDRLDKKISMQLDKIDRKLERFINRPSWVTVSIITFLSSGFFTMLALMIRGKM